MLIKIDSREEAIKIECITRVLKYEDIKIETNTLDIGDIIICDNEGNEKAIIERKTLNDLASSIKDGRYGEQSYRLNGCSLPNPHIYYLVEGTLASYNPKRSRLERKALISSFTTISYFKGFSLHRTENIGESAEWLLSFTDKLRRTKETSTLTNTANDYVNVTSRVKKDNITPDNIGAIMLSQIPGVSTAVAVAVMDKYTNICHLIQILGENQHALSEIYTVTKQGKQRKISKTSQANIYNFLLPNVQKEISVNTA